MSRLNHCPAVCAAPVLHRVLPLPSIALEAGSPPLVVDAVATHPARGSATCAWAVEAMPTPIITNANASTFFIVCSLWLPTERASRRNTCERARWYGSARRTSSRLKATNGIATSRGNESATCGILPHLRWCSRVVQHSYVGIIGVVFASIVHSQLLVFSSARGDSLPSRSTCQEDGAIAVQNRTCARSQSTCANALSVRQSVLSQLRDRAVNTPMLRGG
jgi:hypothetical protein